MTRIYPFRGRRSIVLSAKQSEGFVCGFGINRTRTNFHVLHDYLIMYTFVFNFAFWYLRIDLSRFYKDEI